MKFLEKVNFENRTPLTYAEAVTAMLSLIGGIYLLTPFLTLPFAVEGQVAMIVANAAGIVAVGVVAIVLSLWNLWAIYKGNYKQRARSIFWMTMLRLYSILALILITGIFPMTWLAALNVLILQVIFYLNNRFMATVVQR